MSLGKSERHAVSRRDLEVDVAVVILSSSRLVVGGTSQGPSTVLERGETVVDDDHWAEIMDRYRAGLTPHIASGRLSVRYEIDCPDPPPSLDGVSVRDAAPIIDAESTESTLLLWIDDPRVTIRRLVEARLDELARRDQ